MSASQSTCLAIRSASRGDADLVLGFIRDLAEYEKLSHEVDTTGQALDEALFGETPRVFCEIAEWDGEAVGFALWFYSFSTFRGRHGIYLEDLFIREAMRGRGIGKALLARLARRCRDEGLMRLEWSVLDWNEPSIAFYRSIGAQPMNEWTVQRLTGDALVDLAELA
jgi:GNAT superfamily N-acetyltransferase